MKTFDSCNWAVCYDIDGKTQDDGQPKREISAWFNTPFQAEDFIKLCLPDETKSRFYILHREKLAEEL